MLQLYKGIKKKNKTMEDVITLTENEIQLQRADSYDKEPLWDTFDSLERIKNKIDFIGVLMESGYVSTDTKRMMVDRIEDEGELIRRFSKFLSYVLG